MDIIAFQTGLILLIEILFCPRTCSKTIDKTIWYIQILISITSTYIETYYSPVPNKRHDQINDSLENSSKKNKRHDQNKRHDGTFGLDLIKDMILLNDP